MSTKGDLGGSARDTGPGKVLFRCDSKENVVRNSRRGVVVTPALPTEKLLSEKFSRPTKLVTNRGEWDEVKGNN